ncbi:MAG: tetratricopeptide repeat protein [Dokdonella sp.]
MKRSKWVLAITCASALLTSFGAFAQMSSTSSSGSAKKNDHSHSKPDKAANEYPNATRAEPKLDMSSGDQRDLNKAADLVNDNKAADAQPLLDKVIANDHSSKYAQAFAHQLQAQVYWDQDKGDQTIAEYKKAIAFDAMPNASQFQMIYALAQTQLQQEKYQDALATLADWEKLAGKQSAEELAVKANAYYRTDQFQPAVDTMKKAMSMTDKPADSWTQILMASYFELNQYDQAAEVVQQQLGKDPNNKKLINQLATIYIQGDKPQKALDLMAKAKSQGQITSSEDYVQLAKLQASADKPKDAAATMKEGFSKGIIQPTYDTNKLLGDVCTQAEDDACAIDGYSKASPMAKDGNVDYQLGYLLFYSSKSKEAIDVLNRAITKGSLRQEGEAYLLRGDAENDLDQNAAAMADWNKAKAHSSTKTMAEQRIKAAKGGVKIQRAKKK